MDAAFLQSCFLLFKSAFQEASWLNNQARCLMRNLAFRSLRLFSLQAIFLAGRLVWLSKEFMLANLLIRQGSAAACLAYL